MKLGLPTTALLLGSLTAINAQGLRHLKKASNKKLVQIDFNHLKAGTILDGKVDGIEGVKFNSFRSDTNDPRAMIFDSNNPTGGDDDLADKKGDGLGKMMIYSEDGDSSDPDDHWNGGQLIVNFDDEVTVESLGIKDNEEGVTIRLFDKHGRKKEEIAAPTGEDGEFFTVWLRFASVKRMVIDCHGSCAVPFINYLVDDDCPAPTPAPTPKPPKTCPPENWPHPKKCELKKGEISLEFENEHKEQIKRNYQLKFKSVFGKSWTFNAEGGHYEKPGEYKKWYLSYGETDGAKYKKDQSGSGSDSSDGFSLCHSDEPSCVMKRMEYHLFDKDNHRTFNLYFQTSDECHSPPIECKNKNLTPIGLDLDGSGAVEAIRGTFVIDITGDVMVETLDEWFAPTEGILIDTLFGLENGINGKHLFGDMGGAYANGYEKLALRDIDGDGFVNGEELVGLAIWTDANSNAQLDDGELSTLESHDIVSLNTLHSHLKSAAILSNGSTILMEDLYFSEEQLESVA